jgi:hypothetical protein
MRDIRGDLQERANLIEKHITAAGNDFEKTVEQLRCKLKAELAALGVAMLEGYRMFLIDLLRSERISAKVGSTRQRRPPTSLGFTSPADSVSAL